MPRRHPFLPLLAAVGLLALSACGGENTAPEADTTQPAPAVSTQPTAEATEAPDTAAQPSAGALPSELEEQVDEMIATLEAQQTGGYASVTIGTDTWEFDGVLCAFGADEIGEAGAEFVLSAIGDGLQFYVSIDANGESVGLSDIENFDDPSLSWEANEESSGEEFIQLSGRDVSGEAIFVDYVNDGWDEVVGTFEGSCP